ncbi:hypothetical protein [Rhizobium sp. BG4]|uniref:hypothetical protein n=1 Tax=Rhizobium sp. BG4 TaxID=2613770 RepID=UPI001FEF98E7|nr:hypothetical protein [Rhizobium sp. BG4]
MATKEEAIGSGVAGVALAAAAVEMLVRLGHGDVLEQLKSTALDTLSRSVDEYPGLITIRPRKKAG